MTLSVDTPAEARRVAVPWSAPWVRPERPVGLDAATPPHRAPPPRPETTLPPSWLDAIDQIYRRGFGDPRSGEYRTVAIRAGYNEGETQRVFAWVFWVQGRAFAVAWNGLVYPVENVGPHVDVHETIAAIPASARAVTHRDPLPDHARYRWPDVWPGEPESLSAATISPLTVALLIRLGESRAAELVWAAWRRQASHPDDDPLTILTTHWRWALVDRSVRAEMRGDGEVVEASERLSDRVKSSFAILPPRTLGTVAPSIDEYPDLTHAIVPSGGSYRTFANSTPAETLSDALGPRIAENAAFRGDYRGAIRRVHAALISGSTGAAELHLLAQTAQVLRRDHDHVLNSMGPRGMTDLTVQRVHATAALHGWTSVSWLLFCLSRFDAAGAHDVLRKALAVATEAADSVFDRMGDSRPIEKVYGDLLPGYHNGFIGQLTADVARAGDTTVLRDYAPLAIRAASLGVLDLLGDQPLWRHARHSAMRRASRELWGSFVGREGPDCLANAFDRPEEIRNQRILASPFLPWVTEQLRSKRVVGRWSAATDRRQRVVSVAMTDGTRAQGSAFASGDPNAPADGATGPVRCGDVAAKLVTAYVDDIEFQHGWPTARRDRAIARLLTRLGSTR